MLIFNGELKHAHEVTLSDLERGFFYGDGCFETLRLHRGRLPLWPWHLKRLRESAVLLRLELPDMFCEVKDLERLARLLVPEAAYDARLRLSLWRAYGSGRKPRGSAAHWMLEFRGKAPPFFESRTLTQEIVPLTGPWPHHKWLGEGMYVRSLPESSKDEVLFADAEGCLVEGLQSNLWLVRDGQLWTPALESGGIQGVWRRAVLDLKKHWPFVVRESRVPAEWWTKETPVMMSNGLRGFFPLAGYPFPKEWAECVHEVVWNLEGS
ncbi:MAG: aminotransferase class IV [Flavobacteriales bacterium]|nr:aminotransferase class IV [Flavobacteriales bacterium]